MSLSIPSAPISAARFPPLSAVESSEHPRAASRTVRFFTLASPVIAVIALNVFGRPDLDPTLRLVASIGSFVAFIPLIIHVVRRKTELPFMPFYALLFSAYFIIPVFLDDKFSLPFSSSSIADPVVTDSEVLILLGFAMLLIGFYVLPGARFLEKIPRMRDGVDDETGVRTGWILVATGIIVVQFRAYIPVRFQSLGQICQQLGSLGLALLFYYYLQGRLRGPSVGVLFVLIPGMAVLDISGGGIGPVVQHFLPVVGTYWLVRRKFLWKTAIVVALFVIPVSGVKTQFRAIAWDPESNLGVIDRCFLYGDLIRRGYETDENFYYDSFQATMERMNQITTLAAVQSLTPNVIPFWNGATYADLYWSLIPRVIYADKPGKVLGQDFGHRYGLLDKFDRTTSYNFPQLVEFYANFGAWGVGIGMLLLGFVQRLLYHALTAPDAHPSVPLFATIVLARCCNIDSDLSLVYGGLILNITAMALILAVLRARTARLPLELLRFRW